MRSDRCCVSCPLSQGFFNRVFQDPTIYRRHERKRRRSSCSSSSPEHKPEQVSHRTGDQVLYLLGDTPRIRLKKSQSEHSRGAAACPVLLLCLREVLPELTRGQPSCCCCICIWSISICCGCGICCP